VLPYRHDTEKLAVNELSTRKTFEEATVDVIERLMSQSCYTMWACCVQQATSRNITVNETTIFSFHDQEWRTDYQRPISFDTR
jgi:hypothetical protein